MKIDPCGHKKLTAQLGFVVMILGAAMAFLEPMRGILAEHYHVAFVVIGGLQSGFAYIIQNIHKLPCNEPDEHEGGV